MADTQIIAKPCAVKTDMPIFQDVRMATFDCPSKTPILKGLDIPDMSTCESVIGIYAGDVMHWKIR